MGELTLNKSDIELELEEGKTVTDEIIATKRYLSKPITWSSSNPSVATVNASEETRATVTAVAAGETTITATCNVGGEEYTQTCRLTVIEPPSKGDFVEYNVAYTDAYKGYEYTSTNGWRLLDYTNNGDGTLSNVKLISTGVPARLNYYYSNNSSWYVTDNTQLTNFRNVLTNNGTEDYTFYTGERTYYALQASAGMYYNFGNINFAYGAGNRGRGLGYFTKITITSNGETTTYDSNNTTETTGTNLFVPSGINASVRLLTLPEMNKMLGRTDIDSTSAMSDPTGASGLFILNKLKDVSGMSNYTYSATYWWVASPFTEDNTTGSQSQIMCYVSFGGAVGSSRSEYYGVRPVVCLSSNIKLLDTNGDGVLEIKNK